jgi:hypothetical protein
MRRISHLESSMVGQAANSPPDQVGKVSWLMGHIDHLEGPMIGQTANLSPRPASSSRAARLILTCSTVAQAGSRFPRYG